MKFQPPDEAPLKSTGTIKPHCFIQNFRIVPMVVAILPIGVNVEMITHLPLLQTNGSS